MKTLDLVKAIEDRRARAAAHAETLEDASHREFFLKMSESRIVVRGGRTGKKVHFAHIGSSCLGCGKWVRYNVAHFRVTAKEIPLSSACELCFDRELAEATADEGARS